MAKRTQLIGRSPRMEQVINLVSRPEFMRILESAYEPERNTFTDRRGGYGGGGGYEYNGYFKVVETTDESGKAMLKIIDGADPKSNYAGSTDLGYVPVMSIAKQTGQLYLLPEWKVQNDTRVYSFYLRYNIDPGEIRKAVKIASILGDGTIVQRHVTNEILWGNRFFV